MTNIRRKDAQIKISFSLLCTGSFLPTFPHARDQRAEEKFLKQERVFFFVHFIIPPFQCASVDATLLPVSARVQAYRVNKGASTNSIYVSAMHGSLFHRFYDSPASASEDIRNKMRTQSCTLQFLSYSICNSVILCVD